MHEFALADAVVKAAVQAATDAGMNRVTRVVVSVGELQQIRADLFSFSLGQVLTGEHPLIESAEFVVEAEPARFECRVCKTEFGFPEVPPDDDAGEAMHFVPELAHAYMRCPGCGGPDFGIIAGRGVTIRSIDGRGAEDDA